MRFTKLMTAAAVAVSLTSVPVMAQTARPAPAAKLSQVSGTVRDSAKVREANSLTPGAIALLIAALIAVGLGIAAAVGGDDEPRSP